MSDERKYTEREVVERERLAVVRTITRLWPWIDGRTLTAWPGSDTIRDELYPLQKVTRTRVVRLGRYDYRVVDGVVQCLFDGTWQESSIHTVDGTRVIADLIANPTETVDAE
jgi:hypothetical protein